MYEIWYIIMVQQDEQATDMQSIACSSQTLDSLKAKLPVQVLTLAYDWAPATLGGSFTKPPL